MRKEKKKKKKNTGMHDDRRECDCRRHLQLVKEMREMGKTGKEVTVIQSFFSSFSFRN